jgi:predicted lipoprotein
MKNLAALALIALCCLTACNKPTTPSSSSSTVATSAKAPDAVARKLQDYAGASATDCGRLEVHAPDAQSKAASDCAMQAGQSKHPFYVAYDMPGMSVGVAGNSEGRLFSVQSQGEGASATLSSGACPSALRVAASGRVTCFAPGDMGSMGGGHTAIPPDMPNPHALPKPK